MAGAINRFVKGRLLEKRDVGTGSARLDKAMRFPMPGFVRIVSEPYAGSTAVLLQLASRAQELGRLVVYFDLNDALVSSRIAHLDKDRLLVVRHHDPRAVIDVAREAGPCLYVFDGTHLLEQGAESTAVQVRQLQPGATIAVAAHREGPEDLWNETVRVQVLRYHYHRRELIGHRLRVSGSVGSTDHYVSYTSGRLSAAYEHARAELDAGASPGGLFEFGGVSRRGYHRFLADASLKGL